MAMRLLSILFQKVIRTGRLTVIAPDGGRVAFGDGGEPAVTVRIRDSAAARRLMLNPRLMLGEYYMDGSLTIEDGDIYTLLDLCGLNVENLARSPLLDFVNRAEVMLRPLQQHNPIG